jgi:hypothetical protein
MAITVTYPTNAELMEIAQDKLPNLMADRLGFTLMPIRNIDASILKWEQKDNYIGLMQIRGINGSAPRVNRVGQKGYLMQPGVYGEFLDVDELEITTRRPIGQFSGAIPIDDIVMGLQDQLLERRLNRMEQIIWTLLTTGTFSVSSATGGVAHTDTFTLQTSNASDWGTAATATPLADFRAVQLLGRGTSANFGAGSVAYMNQTTFNLLISNINAADLYGRRLAGLSIVNNQQQLNQLLLGDGLPTIEIYEGGYFNDAGTWTLYIPDDKVVVVGKRPSNQLVGEFLLTRNATNPTAEPGAYQMVVDSAETTKVPPRVIQVHEGWNGGAAIYFPSAIVIMDVS